MQKVPTKYPPPPYLPGEVRRRAEAAAIDEDSEEEAINAKLAYDKNLFHYL